jgi:hypothetical protein
MQFKEIISVYTDNHMKPVNAFAWQKSEFVIVKECDTHSYHLGLKS